MPSLKCARRRSFYDFYNAAKRYSATKSITRDDVGKNNYSITLIVMAINEKRLKVKFKLEAFMSVTLAISINFPSQSFQHKIDGR